MIRVLFFAPTNWMGRLISMVTHSRFCHVGIQINDKYYEEQNGGFVESAPRTDFDAEFHFFENPIPTEVTKFLDRTVGKPYSWSTILADLIAAYTPWHWQIEADGEHVCSGAVTWLLCLFGGHITPRFSDVDFQPDSVTPGQLADLLGVK